jgi:hypothetical protein
MRNRPTTRAKAEMRGERAGWSWNAWKRARRKKRVQRRLLKTMQESPWAGLAGGLIAGAAGLLAFIALQSASEKKKAGTALFEFSSDPLTAPRFDRKRAFGWF